MVVLRLAGEPSATLSPSAEFSVCTGKYSPGSSPRSGLFQSVLSELLEAFRAGEDVDLRSRRPRPRDGPERVSAPVGRDPDRGCGTADPDAAQGLALPFDPGAPPTDRPGSLRGRDGGLRQPCRYPRLGAFVAAGADPLGGLGLISSCITSRTDSRATDSTQFGAASGISNPRYTLYESERWGRQRARNQRRQGTLVLTTCRSLEPFLDLSRTRCGPTRSSRAGAATPRSYNDFARRGRAVKALQATRICRPRLQRSAHRPSGDPMPRTSHAWGGGSEWRSLDLTNPH